MIEIDRIYNENCLKTMSIMENDQIDMVLTSPPYDNIRNYNGYEFDFETIAKELFRVLKNGGVIIWVVGDTVSDGSETGNSFKQVLFFKDLGLNLHDTMIYQKSGSPFPDKTRYFQCFEYMFVLSKGRPKTINLIKDRKNLQYGAKIANPRAHRQTDGSVKPNSAFRIDPNRKISEFGIRFNIWKYEVGFMKSTLDKIAYQHPAMFPEKLANDHIISWSNPGDLIYDPFMGSGTTAKMARINKRHYIGSEISLEYCKIAEERLKNPH